MRLHSRTLVTSVSNQFIDYYMPQANGEFVKVYLYLLRCASDPTLDAGICSIADRCNHTEKDVARALRYWEQAGLIKLTKSPDKTKEREGRFRLREEPECFLQEL